MFEDLSRKLDGVLRRLRGQGKVTEANVAETLREVRRVLLETRLIQEGGLTYAQAELLRGLLDVDLVVTGTVFDYADAATGGAAPLTGFTTTGIDASLPSAVVDDMILSARCTSPPWNFAALPRSIRWGKSTFNGCGGTYGHFAM